MYGYFAAPLVRLVGWGTNRLFYGALDLKDRLELRRLNRLDESSLLVEIAHRNNPPALLQSSEDLVRYGRQVANRLLPGARRLICPHRQTLLSAVEPQGADVVAGVFELLSGNVPTSLAKPLAALIVRRGLAALCEQAQ
ncbi:hypothetical protein [Actinoplanes sp. NPDC049265]|uniref:hypothetical protein n=1 Tax=Actinoplanes sp. NPDC049265 TaxID=3363902 RepID=UPI003723BD99